MTHSRHSVLISEGIKGGEGGNYLDFEGRVLQTAETEALRQEGAWNVHETTEVRVARAEYTSASSQAEKE